MGLAGGVEIFQVFVFSGIVEAEQAAALVLDIGNHFVKLMNLAGAANDVHLLVGIEQVLAEPLSHATDDGEDEVFLLLVAAAELADFADDFVFGMLADGAGVEDDYRGFGGIVGRLIAEVLKLPGDEFGVELVHLATHGFDVKGVIHNYFGISKFVFY